MAKLSESLIGKRVVPRAAVVGLVEEGKWCDLVWQDEDTKDDVMKRLKDTTTVDREAEIVAAYATSKGLKLGLASVATGRTAEMFFTSVNLLPLQ